jgi:hypothetical protein
MRVLRPGDRAQDLNSRVMTRRRRIAGGLRISPPFGEFLPAKAYQHDAMSCKRQRFPRHIPKILVRPPRLHDPSLGVPVDSLQDVRCLVDQDMSQNQPFDAGRTGCSTRSQNTVMFTPS